MKKEISTGENPHTPKAQYITKRGMARIMILTATDEELEEIIRAAEKILNGEENAKEHLPQ